MNMPILVHYYKTFVRLQKYLAASIIIGKLVDYIVNDFEKMHLIEASKELIDQIPDYPNIIKHCSMFEDFQTDLKFDTIIMSHVLEHIEKPIEVLSRIRDWLADDGVFVVSVPNAKSLHRLAAVKMGLLPTEYTLNERDHALGHYRVYDLKQLGEHLRTAGFSILHSGGSFLKPLSNGQIEQYWSREMMEGFFELGKDFPDHCAEIYAICSK